MIIRYSTAKKLFLLFVFIGVVLIFSPMIYGIVVYDEPIFNFITYIGLGIFILSGIFERVLSRCPMCKKTIPAKFGGLAYVIMRVKTKSCPHCLAELK